MVLEHVEQSIKTVITDSNMLPKDCKHLQHDEWGVELADYFDCVAGQMLLVSPVAIELALVMNSCQSINKGVSWCCTLLHIRLCNVDCHTNDETHNNAT